MAVNDGELETDLPIFPFASTIPSALGSLICLILSRRCPCSQFLMGACVLSEPPGCSETLRFMGRLHLGRVRTREECDFYRGALVLMRLIPWPVVVRTC